MGPFFFFFPRLGETMRISVVVPNPPQTPLFPPPSYPPHSMAVVFIFFCPFFFRTSLSFFFDMRGVLTESMQNHRAAHTCEDPLNQALLFFITSPPLPKCTPNLNASECPSMCFLDERAGPPHNFPHLTAPAYSLAIPLLTVVQFPPPFSPGLHNTSRPARLGGTPPT